MATARSCWSFFTLTRNSLFPVLAREFRRRPALAIGDLELEILRADALLELDVGGALVVECVRAVAAQERDQRMLADLEIADVHTIRAALEQWLVLARR